jgi:hypothetical protein
MKRNPFMKYLGKEDILQNKVMSYIKYNYPSTLYTHVSNEGKRTPFEQYKMKFLGSKAGLPDIMIFTPNKEYNGLAIELKVGYNKPTNNQKYWLDQLQKNNWRSCWYNNYEDVINEINNYLKNGKT